MKAKPNKIACGLKQAVKFAKGKGRARVTRFVRVAPNVAGTHAYGRTPRAFTNIIELTADMVDAAAIVLACTEDGNRRADWKNIIPSRQQEYRRKARAVLRAGMKALKP